MNQPFGQFVISLSETDTEIVRLLPPEALPQVWRFQINGNLDFKIEIYETEEDITTYSPESGDLVFEQNYTSSPIELNLEYTFNSRYVRYIPNLLHPHQVVITYLRDTEFDLIETGLQLNTFVINDSNPSELNTYEFTLLEQAIFTVRGCGKWYSSFPVYVQYLKEGNPSPNGSSFINSSSSGAGVSLPLAPGDYRFTVALVDVEYRQLKNGWVAVSLTTPDTYLNVCALSGDFSVGIVYPIGADPDPDPDPGPPETTYIYVGPPTGVAFAGGEDHLLYLNVTEPLPFAAEHPYAQALIDIGYVEPQ